MRVSVSLTLNPSDNISIEPVVPRVASDKAVSAVKKNDCFHYARSGRGGQGRASDRDYERRSGDSSGYA